MTNANNQCKICENTQNNKIYKVKEMQLGLREYFDYQHCNNCGCMQLLSLPGDFSRYYPNQSYYSFTSSVKFPQKPDYLRKIKADYLIHGKHPILGRLLSLGYKKPEYYNWMKIPRVKWNDRILDVGCGNGSLLAQLSKIGFTNLTGVDPFINEEKEYGMVRIFKKDIYELEGEYNYIMLNHSFEHMTEPLRVLLRLHELLLPGKYLLIRTPLMNMYGWKTYGVNWFALDAPRHIFIHTLESIQMLTEKSGFIISKIIFDTDPIDVIMSQQYQKDIASSDPASFLLHKKDLYKKNVLENARRLVKKIDAENQGDQASFYLYKPKDTF